jgi:hypothetical protein
MSGRHKAGSGPPADEEWQRTSDRACWRAYRFGLMLTVTRRAHEAWVADVEREGVVVRRGPVPFRTRRAAMAFCDRKAEELQAGLGSLTPIFGRAAQRWADSKAAQRQGPPQ